MKNPFKAIKKLFIPEHPLIAQVTAIVTELELYFAGSMHNLERFGQEFDEIVEYLLLEKEIYEARKDLQTAKRSYRMSKDPNTKRVYLRDVVRAEFFFELLRTQRSDAKLFKVEKRISLLTKYIEKLRASASVDEKDYARIAERHVDEMRYKPNVPANVEFVEETEVPQTPPTRREEKVFHTAEKTVLGEEPKPSPS